MQQKPKNHDIFLTNLDITVSKWGIRFAGRFFPACIGKSGITVSKSEGDGATPAGVHKLIGVLYRPDRVMKPCDWAVQIKPNDIWSDDTRDPDYNMLNCLPHKYSHERLFRSDPLFDIIILTDWNWPYPVKGRGSAIFIHAWRKPRHPTEGCIGLSSQNLLWIIRRIKPVSKLIVGI